MQDLTEALYQLIQFLENVTVEGPFSTFFHIKKLMLRKKERRVRQTLQVCRWHYRFGPHH